MIAFRINKYYIGMDVDCSESGDGGGTIADGQNRIIKLGKWKWQGNERNDIKSTCTHTHSLEHIKIMCSNGIPSHLCIVLWHIGTTATTTLNKNSISNERSRLMH